MRAWRVAWASAMLWSGDGAQGTEVSMFPAGAQAGTEVIVEVSSSNGASIEALLFVDPRFLVEEVYREADEVWPVRWRERNHFRISIPASMPAGRYEVRGIGEGGVGDPLGFFVSEREGIPEYRESGREKSSVVPLELGQWVNGKVQGEEVDRYQFHAREGERILVLGQASEPEREDFPLLWISDWVSRRVAAGQGISGEAVRLDFLAQESGIYDLNVLSQAEASTAQQTYRFMAFSSPHVDGLRPLIGSAGNRQDVQVVGRNLPGGKLEPQAGVGERSYQVRSQSVSVPRTADSSSVPVEWFQVPLENSGFVEMGIAEQVLLEEEEGSVLRLEVPATVSGGFDFPGDSDAYRFPVEPGKWYQVEAIGRRKREALGASLVVQQVLPGKWMHEDFAALPSSNSTWAWREGRRTLGQEFWSGEEPGEVVVILADRKGRRNPGHDYGLTLREAKPGFHLFTDSRTPLLHAGEAIGLPVFVRREGGFSAAVRLEARNLPEGIQVQETILWEGSQAALVVVRADADMQDWQGWIEIVGTGLEAGRRSTAVARNLQTGGQTPLVIRSRREDQEGEMPRVTVGGPVARQEGGLVLPVQLEPAEAWKDRESIRVILDGAPGVVAPAEITLPGDQLAGELPLQPDAAAPEEWFPLLGTVVIAAEVQISEPQPSENLETWASWRDLLIQRRPALNRKMEEALARIRPAEEAWAEALKQVAKVEAEEGFWEKRKARAALERAVANLEDRRAEVKKAREWIERSLEAEEEISSWLDQAETPEASREITKRFWSDPLRVQLAP